MKKLLALCLFFIGLSVSIAIAQPSVPVLQGSPTSPTSITLSWFQVKNSQGTVVFELQRCKGVHTTCINFATIATTPALSFVDTGLTPFTSYVYRVRANDATTIPSGWSKILTIVTPQPSTVPAPTIGVSTTALSFTQVGGGVPVSQTITVTNTGGGTLLWAVSENTPWLSVSPSAGTAPSSVTISADPAGLAKGLYTGVVTLSSSLATNSPQTITINLTVTSPPGIAELFWDPVSDPRLTGYKIYRGTASGVYGTPIGVVDKNTTSFVDATGIVGTTYYFTVSSYAVDGTESIKSNEVSKSY